jgi:hypothetical protein
MPSHQKKKRWNQKQRGKYYSLKEKPVSEEYPVEGMAS